LLEPAIIARARRDDPAAVEQVARYALKIGLRVGSSIVGSRSQGEDVAQNTAILTLRHLGSLRDPARLDGWIARTATTESLQLLRKPHQQHEQTVDDPAPMQGRQASEAEFDLVASSEELREALARLSPRQRAALALRYVLDLDDAQIAHALGCRVGTVRALLSRSRAELRADPRLTSLRPRPAIATHQSTTARERRK
jgi:RNA polymerase sigma factor (sigma-70 family)